MFFAITRPREADFLFPLPQEQVFHIDSRTESGKGRCSFNPRVNTVSVMLSRCLPSPFQPVLASLLRVFQRTPASRRASSVPPIFPACLLALLASIQG